MLSDQETQLLTAFVDGELAPLERKAAMRLLEKSSEARALLKHLQENVHKLKKLPVRKVEPSLVADVLQAIADQQTQRRPIAPRRRAWLPYLAATMAASVLIAVVSLIYWMTVIETPLVPKDIVKNDTDKKIEPLPQPMTPTPKKENRLLAQAIAITIETHDYFANYVPPKPYQLFFGDLAQADSKASGEFTHQLDRENNKSVYLDITVDNNDAAMMRLREALKARQINLVTDPAVNKLLKGKNAPKAEFLVYAENLTTTEVTKLMRELGQRYVVGQANKQKMVDSPYRDLSIAPSDGENLQRVAKALGVPVSAVERKDRKETKVPAKKERQAVVLPATGAGTTAKEVRQFVNQRPAPQPGTLQVIIKIHQK